MIWLIGIRKNTSIEVREKLSLTSKKQVLALQQMKKIFDEVVIISTCNRTEIYFKGFFNKEEQLKKVFDILDWDYSLSEYVFANKNKEACRHLFEVICGFHSKILGEDQILGQVRDAYELSMNNNCINSKLLRLFQDAISCGKKFRTESRLFKIPVSSASIAVNKVIDQGAKSLMVLGYGNVGQLVVKYALGSALEKIYVVLRSKCKASDLKDERIELIDFDIMREFINNVDSVIACTSAPHIIVHKRDINEEGNKLTLIDLSLPRNIDESLAKYERVELLDIDIISKLDDVNKKLRMTRMIEYKTLIDEYLNDYIEWINIRGVSEYIKLIKDTGNNVAQDRIRSFNHKSKSKEDKALAETLIKSTSDYYVNRAIKLLKEEKLKGREDKCIRILSKIFL